MSVSSAPLLVSKRDQYEIWTLNQAHRRNPISDPSMVNAIVDAVDRASDDLECGAVILTGDGPAFSAGGDVRAMRTGDGIFGDPPALQRSGYQKGIQRLARALVECDVPLIAAINGPAIGAGFDLALMCDIRIASTEATFACSFLKLGLIPGDGGAWLLPRVVGHARATELVLTARTIHATEAVEWGVVSSVVAPDALMPAAEAIAVEIASLPRTAARMAKSLLRRAPDLGFSDTLDLSAALQPLCHTTAEHRDLVMALGKRGKP